MVLTTRRCTYTGLITVDVSRAGNLPLSSTIVCGRSELLVTDYMSRFDNDASRAARQTITSSSSLPPVLSSWLRPHHLLQLQQLGLTVQRHQTQTYSSSNDIDTRAETHQPVVSENSTNSVSESPSVRIHFDVVQIANCHFVYKLQQTKFTAAFS